MYTCTDTVLQSLVVNNPFSLSLSPPIPRPANCAPENSIPPPIHSLTHTHTHINPPQGSSISLTRISLEPQPTEQITHPPPPKKTNRHGPACFSFCGGRSFPEKRSEPLAKVEILKNPHTHTDMLYAYAHTRAHTHRRTRGVRDCPWVHVIFPPTHIHAMVSHSLLSQGTNSVWSELLPP